jgi:hypothetical protein
MRAEIHDGPEHMLQSETEYIDARPHQPASTKASCTARPDHTFGSFATKVERATSVTVSAMPRKRPHFAAQGNVAMGHERTHAPQQTASLFDSLSARPSSEGGAARPSALAVLTISSNFVGACTHLGLPYESHRLQAIQIGSTLELQQ